MDRERSMTLSGLILVCACILGLSSCEVVPPPKCDDCPEMVRVPAGSFSMGSSASEQGRWDDEGPRHLVTIGESFEVGKYEVTYAQWDACVADGGCGHRPDHGLGRGDYPVTDVSWNDAQEYVSWLSGITGSNYRLLSEGEWEYVARGGKNTAQYWGAGLDRQCLYANGADEFAKLFFPDWVIVGCNDGHDRAAPVGTYRPNPFGLYDVLGNVWELTQDCFNEGYAGAPADGSAWLDGYCGVAVMRGGAWNSIPAEIRSAYRGWAAKDYRSSLIGLRVARALTAHDLRPPNEDLPGGGGGGGGSGGGGGGGDNLPPDET